jgi:hypothetical protein
VGPDAQFFDCLGQLRAADFPDGIASSGAGLPDFAELARGGGYQPRGHAASRVHRDGPANGEGLVVGVGKQNEEAMIGHGGAFGSKAQR